MWWGYMVSIHSISQILLASPPTSLFFHLPSIFHLSYHFPNWYTTSPTCHMFTASPLTSGTPPHNIWFQKLQICISSFWTLHIFYLGERVIPFQIPNSRSPLSFPWVLGLTCGCHLICTYKTQCSQCFSSQI